MNDVNRTQAASREQRRAAALRENLKRRKAQARAQSAAPPKSEGDELTPSTSRSTDQSKPEPDGN
jgi:hypothetical protein